jgi:hypothetical protein
MIIPDYDFWTGKEYVERFMAIVEKNSQMSKLSFHANWQFRDMTFRALKF